MVRIGKKVIPTWILALILGAIIGSVVTATIIFSQFKIGYEIQPATESPTLSPNPVMLDLGTIPSGSTGSKDFGNTSRLSLPAGYEITFELDTTTTDDFSSFTVHIYIYEGGTTTYKGGVYLSKSFSSDYYTLDAGDYDLHVEIDYTAKSVTSTTSGEVAIKLLWPG